MKIKSLFLCILIFVCGVGVGAVGLFEYKVQTEISAIKVYASDQISFHFLELGNQSTGDCTFVKAGEIDILIDAGSKTSSISTISKYINKYVTDNTLEYVIVTHAHEDHYAGFATDSNTDSLFDLYNIGTIIDFAQIEEGRQDKKIYKNYQRELSEAVLKGAKHYTALECVQGLNGATNSFKINTSTTMKILDQKYYSQVASDENDHSVCTLFTYENQNFLFTGDLTEEGEKSLVALNPDLPECVLYKAGHHGSYTSSSHTLLSIIKPKICTICCCAGNVEYLTRVPQNLKHSFPAQEFIDRISVYTEKVYVTTLGKITFDSSKNKYINDGFTSMNGNITVTAKDQEVEVKCSNNNTILKDTEWFKNNRDMPSAWQSR